MEIFRRNEIPDEPDAAYHGHGKDACPRFAKRTEQPERNHGKIAGVNQSMPDDTETMSDDTQA